MSTNQFQDSLQDVDELKQLEFVRGYAEYWSNMAKKVYSSGRQYVPSGYESTVTNVEQQITSYTAPLITELQDYSNKYLTVADKQVNTLLGNVGKYKAQSLEAYNANKQYLRSNLDKYTGDINKGLNRAKQAKTSGQEQAFSLVESIVAYIKALPQCAVNEAHKAAQKLSAAWEKLLENPQVSRAVSSFQPGIDAAKSKYFYLHDVLVNHPLYQSAWSKSASVYSSVQSSSVGKTAGPYVASVKHYFDPILNSSLVSGAFEHVKPASEVGHTKLD